ncbi:hypothetical protein LTR84_000856 [Exophiala bonariae]|uniref:Exonuclease V, mitochondrial n=1 Tax=Exophiala bonariae TaxID=1690606 RepID=A0AAV9NS93_9EURO|nr:hypothetical protein LTR84_000856 [Exophiala bonariae]
MSNFPEQSTYHKLQVQVVAAQADDKTNLEYDDDEFSDFGADPEELALIEHLLQEAIAKQSTSTQTVSLAITDIEDYELPRSPNLPEVLDLQSAQQWNHSSQIKDQEYQSSLVEIICDESAAVLTNTEDKKDRTPEPNGDSSRPLDRNPAEPTTPLNDTRSPLERFRRPPKKPFSVTDLTSPAWCELQYFYTISSKTGRKKPTSAMKKGTKVHKVLEEEVHVTVPVTITKKEDSWGLRLWNIIHGLKTLRETGRTREFEVWGTVGGELVNGVIDELSYDCPDPKLEEQSLKSMGKQDNEPPMPGYQASIREYLILSEHREQGQSIADALTMKTTRDVQPSNNAARDRRIYITDVKTRGVSSLPSGSSIRPTIVQLHLYHHLLENFAQGNFPLEHLSSRFNFDVNETFSDSFIAQIGNLNQEAFDLVNSSNENDMEVDLTEDNFVASTQESIDIILQHNNISSLWQYMLSQLQETFMVRSTASSTYASQNTSSNPQSEHEPPSATPQSVTLLDDPPQSTLPTLLSPLLTAQYLSSRLMSSTDPSKPQIIGSKSVIFNPSFLRSYLYDTLAFWRGEREPKGVVLSDAWKCRVCEFRDGCAWVKEQDQRALNDSLERRRIREEGVGIGVVGDEVTRSHV